jgi:uncharacterized protein YlxP (DUF503 family)
MVIAVCTLELLVPHSHSLKDKRQVVKSLVESLRQRFNLSVAEVDHLDAWGRAGIGMACVSNDSAFASQVLNRAVGFVESNPRVVLQDYQMETL